MPLTALEADKKSDRQQPLIRANGSASATAAAAPPPWRRMLKSSAVWAIVVNNFAFHYAFYVVMNWLPTYFNR